MIKALIFDCFGVLAEDGWAALKRRYMHHQGLEQAAYELIQQSDLGLLGEAELFKKLSELLKAPESAVSQTLTSEQKNDDMFRHIEANLVGKYKVAMLSNVNKGFMEKFLTEHEKSLFDAMLLSGEMGIAKPDPRAFMAAAKAVDTPHDHCLMIDDNDYNCLAARKIGMNSILYKDYKQFLGELETLLTNPK